MRRAIILAGGRGTRLRAGGPGPVKPLVMVGGIPIVEIILRQLVARGFHRATLCTTPYTAALERRVGDGSGLGISVDYSRSDRLLGTAGPLRLVEGFDEPALVMNGDVLSAFDYDAVLRWHLERSPAVTVVLVRAPVTIPFGVVETDGNGRVREMREKPTLHPLCSSGVYVVDPAALGCMDREHMDMPELVERLLQTGRPVGALETEGRWHDVGTPEQLRRADADFEAHRTQFLPDTQSAREGVRCVAL